MIDHTGVEYLQAETFCFSIYNKNSTSLLVNFSVSYYKTPEPASPPFPPGAIIAVSIVGVLFVLLGLFFMYRYYHKKNKRLEGYTLVQPIIEPVSVQEETSLEESSTEHVNLFRHSNLEEGFSDKY